MISSFFWYFYYTCQSKRVFSPFHADFGTVSRLYAAAVMDQTMAYLTTRPSDELYPLSVNFFTHPVLSTIPAKSASSGEMQLTAWYANGLTASPHRTPLFSIFPPNLLLIKMSLFLGWLLDYAFKPNSTFQTLIWKQLTICCRVKVRSHWRKRRVA